MIPVLLVLLDKKKLSRPDHYLATQRSDDTLRFSIKILRIAEELTGSTGYHTFQGDVH